MTEDQVKHMVERFLRWRLPQNFAPDGGVTFEKFGNAGTPHQYRREPVGTNLLDFMQASEMVRYMVEGLPLAASPAPASGTTKEVVRVFADLISLCENGTVPGAFRNGVTDQSGSLDEGECYADRVISQARAALAALRREDGTKTETGWLIERQDRGAPEWYRLVNSAAPNNFWTKNAAEALRFARRTDAEAYCADSGLDDPGFTVHITEHAWGP